MGQEIRGISEDPPLNRPVRRGPRRSPVARARRTISRSGAISPASAAFAACPSTSSPIAPGFPGARSSVSKTAPSIGRPTGSPADSCEPWRRRWAWTRTRRSCACWRSPRAATTSFAYRRDALRRWAIASALLLGGSAAVFGLWSLWGGASDPAEHVSREVIYRRDAVRALAEKQRAFVAGSESLVSEREGNPD